MAHEVLPFHVPPFKIYFVPSSILLFSTRELTTKSAARAGEAGADTAAVSAVEIIRQALK